MIYYLQTGLINATFETEDPKKLFDQTESLLERLCDRNQENADKTPTLVEDDDFFYTSPADTKTNF